MDQFFDAFPEVEPVKPMLNLGAPFDIPTGRYEIGENGENILNGGLSHITGIGGRGNTYKTALALFMLITVLYRYPSTLGLPYDSETTLTYQRINQLAVAIFGYPVDFTQIERVRLSGKETMVGNKWFDALRDLLRYRRDNAKDYNLTTPFLDREGKKIKKISPVAAALDSLSQMDIESVEAMYDKNEVGESGLNTVGLKQAGAKAQVVNQLPGLMAGGNGFIIMTAHLGDVHQLNPMDPPSKKLAFMQGKVKFKYVPEGFLFLTNNCWLAERAQVLKNDGDKGPEFPRKNGSVKGDTDLMKITLQNLRAKSGPTGMPFDVIVSQSDGVHRGLTCFWYLKNQGKPGYGMGGHDRGYYFELYPNVKMQRTTVRGKIDEDPLLQRAIEFTTEIHQIKTLWHDVNPEILFEPVDLYKKIIEQGYDWEILLSTRGYWMFEEDIGPATPPYLSTMDLLSMAAGHYKPKWYDSYKGVPAKKEKAEEKTT